MITTLVFSAVVLILFLVSECSWFNVLSPERNDIVFDGRFKEYGAYALRREQHRHVFFALLISTGILGGAGLWITGHRAEIQTAIPDATNALIEMILPPIAPTPVTPPARQEQPAPKTRSASNNNTVIEVVSQPVTAIVPAGGSPGTPGGEEGGIDIPSENPGGTQVVATAAPVVPEFVEYPDQMPEFPGGESALFAFIRSRVNYDKVDLIHHVNGTMWFTFVVSEDGSISDVTLERGIPMGQGLAGKAAKAIRSMPRWKPGEFNGRPVKYRYRIPIRCEVADNR